jgi:predicted NAD-dependent protein-ADP-ribosyltransferase YbiA (DUF1768 family)
MEMKPQLFYFSKSADKKPGQGSNETLGSYEPTYLEELATIPHWRKILSNFYEGIFEFEGKHYQTVEHCFQGEKISGVNSELGELFTIESDSKYSRGGGEMARRQRKMVMLNPSELFEWNQRKDILLERILRAKFTQVKRARQVLIATREAELWHGARGVPKARQLSLEKIRNDLSFGNAPENQSEEKNEEEEWPPSKRQRAAETSSLRSNNSAEKV